MSVWSGNLTQTTVGSAPSRCSLAQPKSGSHRFRLQIGPKPLLCCTAENLEPLIQTGPTPLFRHEALLKNGSHRSYCRSAPYHCSVALPKSGSHFLLIGPPAQTVVLWICRKVGATDSDRAQTVVLWHCRNVGATDSDRAQTVVPSCGIAEKWEPQIQIGPKPLFCCIAEKWEPQIQIGPKPLFCGIAESLEPQIQIGPKPLFCGIAEKLERRRE